jgi:hypothetical protein
MPFQKFAKDLGKFDLPVNFSLSQKPLTQLLEKSHFLIYTSSTACIEGLAMGVPVIHVESDFIIDIDPLDFSPEARESVRSPADIKKSVDLIVAKNQGKILEKQKISKKIVRELFGEVNDNVYDLFLNS